MNIITTFILTFVILYYLDKYVPSCTESDEIEYRYIPRTLNHYTNDANESTNDMIRSMTNEKGNSWLNYNKIT